MLPTEENYISIEPQKLQSVIDKLLLKISRDKIDGNLKLFPHAPIQENISLESIMIKCYKKEIREDDFVNFLYKYAALYTLRYSDLVPSNFESMSREEILQYMAERIMDISEDARSTLNKGDRFAGEMGEILVFLLLEARGITQLLNKMSLKTSANEAIKGLDGIHIGTRDKDILLFLCQSKLDKDYSQSVSSALNDVQKYVDDPKREDMEFKLVRSNIDKEKFGDQHADDRAYSFTLSQRCRESRSHSCDSARL